MRKHPEWFKQAKALGLAINVWTVNDTDVMREMIDAGADFITTDVPHDALIFVSSKF
jgi:glycerophosphoryl diester phosphodiesterase